MRTGIDLRRLARGLARRAVEHGVPPSWFGHRVILRADLDGDGRLPDGVTRATVHERAVAANPLPRNVTDRDELPRDAGWWGYSMYDVPQRRSGPTYLATIPNAVITSIRDERRNFVPAILSSGGRSLEAREVRWRDAHATARRNLPVHHLPSATWILERSYHNHSHWLTAHLPKLLVLRDLGRIDDVVFPTDLSTVASASLQRLGIEPRDHPRFEEGHSLHVDELTVVGNDRFRPELLRRVRSAYTPAETRAGHRKVYVSRARAGRRRLVNEPTIERALAARGFESVILEELDFDQQVELMTQASVVCGPHGAGLTNMIFCREGTHVVEFADLDFPNPNFYALASALGHHYWLVRADGVGDAPPLVRDMRVDARLVDDTLDRVEQATSAA